MLLFRTKREQLSVAHAQEGGVDIEECRERDVSDDFLSNLGPVSNIL
jgi:hypothetical protein